MSDDDFSGLDLILPDDDDWGDLDDLLKVDEGISIAEIKDHSQESNDLFQKLIVLNNFEVNRICVNICEKFLKSINDSITDITDSCNELIDEVQSNKFLVQNQKIFFVSVIDYFKEHGVFDLDVVNDWSSDQISHPQFVVDTLFSFANVLVSFKHSDDEVASELARKRINLIEGYFFGTDPKNLGSNNEKVN